MKTLALLAILTGCAIPHVDDQGGSLAFELGALQRVGFENSKVAYDVCVAVAESGGTIRLTGVTEGTIAVPTDIPVVTTAPNDTCPTEVAGGEPAGFAVFRWLTARGRATVQVRYTRGAVLASSYVSLVGDAFPGYIVSLDGTVAETEMLQQFTVLLTYADEAKTPAANIALAVTGVPALMTVFPATPRTDQAGKARIAVSHVTEDTSVFVTPAGGDPLLVTMLAGVEPPPE